MSDWQTVVFCTQIAYTYIIHENLMKLNVVNSDRHLSAATPDGY